VDDLADRLRPVRLSCFGLIHLVLAFLQSGFSPVGPVVPVVGCLGALVRDVA
jgi:hypothetical protein